MLATFADPRSGRTMLHRMFAAGHSQAVHLVLDAIHEVAGDSGVLQAMYVRSRMHTQPSFCLLLKSWY